MGNHGQEGAGNFELGGKPAAETADHHAALSRDADMSREIANAVLGKPKTSDDVIKSLGTEEHFLHQEPLRMRQQFHLPSTASSQELFEKMAEAAFKEYKHSSPELKAYDLKELGLTGDNISPRTIFAAQQARFVRELGISDPSNYSEIELKMNKKFYADARAGKVPIDYD